MFDLARAGRDEVPADRRSAFDLALAAVGLMRGRLRGDIDAAMQRAQTMFERDGAYAETTAGPDDLRALALTELGIAELWSGDMERARRDLDAARGAATAAGRDWLVVLSTAYLGVEAMVRGRFERAMRLADARRRRSPPARLVRHMAGRRHGRHPAAIAFHRNRLDECAAHAARRRPPRGLGERPLRARRPCRRHGCSAALGRAGAGVRCAEEARWWLARLADHAGDPGPDHALEATVLASMGDDEAAAAQLTGDSEEAAVARARLHLRAGAAAAARKEVEPFLTSRIVLPPTRIEAWVVAAVARDALGDATGAGGALEQALGTAELGGIQRAFPCTVRRSRRCCTATGATARAIGRCSTSWCRRRPPRRRAPGRDPSRRAVGPRGGGAPLPADDDVQPGDRGELFVSVNTVKTHLKAIYRKLDVEDRRSAVRRARELELLSP